ncbi:unnamed protein product [Parnassius mnemosyne]|uniref:phospholipase A2 n=1 Tax=Parnassius mnemosyne TaxID=213953 RepID=A0AAV1L728_9NEOP
MHISMCDIIIVTLLSEEIAKPERNNKCKRKRQSHCSCDLKFRDCLRKTNSLVSAQIGLTYFNVLGPQCFRKAHPIVRCLRRTRITGQKCEEYELDYTKPKMWQWFDSETF